MKKELSPVVIVIVILVVVAAVGMFGYKTMQPAPYKMSPGGGPRQVTPGAVASPSSGGMSAPGGGSPSSGGSSGAPSGAPVSTSGGMTRGMGSPTSGGMTGNGAPPGTSR